MSDEGTYDEDRVFQSQEPAQQRTVEHATVPQFLEETVEVVVASVERVQQKFFEHNFVFASAQDFETRR